MPRMISWGVIVRSINKQIAKAIRFNYRGMLNERLTDLGIGDIMMAELIMCLEEDLGVNHIPVLDKTYNTRTAREICQIIFDQVVVRPLAAVPMEKVA